MSRPLPEQAEVAATRANDAGGPGPRAFGWGWWVQSNGRRLWAVEASNRDAILLALRRIGASAAASIYASDDGGDDLLVKRAVAVKGVHEQGLLETPVRLQLVGSDEQHDMSATPVEVPLHRALELYADLKRALCGHEQGFRQLGGLGTVLIDAASGAVSVQHETWVASRSRERQVG